MVFGQSRENLQRRKAVMEAYTLSRRSMLRAGATGVGAFALADILAACGGDDSGSSAGGGSTPSAAGSANASAPAGQAGGTITIARAADSQGFDKTMVFANSSIWVYVNFWETLTVGSADGTTVDPFLAESWTQSDDKLTWTFKIKEGVKFADGTPMTAADCKFSLDEASSTDGGWEFINSAIDSTEAPDDTTLVVKTKYPWAPLLADLACPSNGIVPKDYGGKSKEEYYEAPMGTGPFMWDTWNKGKDLTLKKSPNSWRTDDQGTQLPYLDSVTWSVVPDSNTRNVQIEGAQVQVNETPPFSTIDQLQSSGKVAVTLFPSTRTDYVVMCEKSEFFKDQNVRLAVSYAIDRESLIKAVLFGNGTAANSFMMPTVPFYDESTPGQTYDMDKAKAALAASGYASGFKCTYSASSGDEIDAAIAQVLQASLGELGITMDIKNVDPTALHTQQQDLDYEISHTYWTMDIPDPDELVQFAVLPEGGGHSLVTGYVDTKAEDLAKQAQQEFDDAKRQTIYTELQKVLAESAFVAPLFYQPLAYATATNVQGFYVKPTGLYDLGVVSLTS